MGIFKLAEKYKKKRKLFIDTEEYSYYLSHRKYIRELDKYTFLSASKLNDFDMIRANILFQAYENKLKIEEEINNVDEHIKSGEQLDHAKFNAILKERLVGLPKFNDGKNTIYIPIFSRPINEMYVKKAEKLLESPYNELRTSFKSSLIDPFDAFGYQLFDSTFTRLIHVASSNKEAAFFHYDTNAIYFVNDQGRLENKLVLFDKFMHHPNYNHMLDRLLPVVDAYFANDYESFILALKKEGFFSMKFLQIVRKKGLKR